MTGYSIRRLRISVVLITSGNYNHGVIYDEVKNTAAQRVAVAAFYTTRTTTTLVGLVLGKIFISRLAHYNAIKLDSTAGKKHYNYCEEGGLE